MGRRWISGATRLGGLGCLPLGDQHFGATVLGAKNLYAATVVGYRTVRASGVFDRLPSADPLFEANIRLRIDVKHRMWRIGGSFGVSRLYVFPSHDWRWVHRDIGIDLGRTIGGDTRLVSTTCNRQPRARRKADHYALVHFYSEAETLLSNIPDDRTFSKWTAQASLTDSCRLVRTNEGACYINQMQRDADVVLCAI